MKCEEFQHAILENLSEPQAPAARKELEDHLRACASCRSETEGFRELIGRLKAQHTEDPGEIFFARQLRSIEEGISRQEQESPFWRRWWVPTLAAAAVVLFLIGYSTLFRFPQTDWRAEWSNAVTWLAQEGTWDEDRHELDELEGPELDAYAQSMNSRFGQPSEEAEINDAEDWQDLDRQELDLLIERLQAGLKERPS